jgi:2-haloacid dehalogenase
MSESANLATQPVASPPRVVIFDVNETLSDMAPLTESFERVGLTRHDVEPWFAGVLRDGFALTAAGANPAFADLASDSLRLRLEARGMTAPLLDSAVAEVMATFALLRVHDDVLGGVRGLRRLGIRLCTLSNGSSTVAKELLDRAALGAQFERLLSVEDAGAWKPHRASYEHALSECGVAEGDAMLVAVHPWDVDGAARAGLRTAWLNRRGSRYPSYFRAPDLEIPDLGELVRVLSRCL